MPVNEHFIGSTVSPLLDALRDPDEQFLHHQLTDWLSSDTILELMQRAMANDHRGDGLDPALTPVNTALPKVAKLVDEVLERLGLTGKNVPFFIRTNENPTAHCNLAFIASGKKEYITLSPQLFDLLNSDEIRAVIAHELAHLYYGHHELTLCIEWLNLEDKKGRLYALANLYRHWQQLSEMAADRASLLAVDDPKNAVTCLARQNLLSLADDLNIEKFIGCQRQRMEQNQLFINRDCTHPPWEFRVLALDIFAKSDFYGALRSEASRRPPFPKADLSPLIEGLKKSPDQSQILEFNFLLIAGNCLMKADNHIHKTELSRLQVILARFLHTPNKQMLCGVEPDDACQQGLNSFGSQIAEQYPDRGPIIFELLGTLMVQDGRIAAEEKIALEMIAKALRIPEQTMARTLLKILRQEFYPAISLDANFT